MSKNIIFCADGTWNGPGQDDNNDGIPDITNVYKLFLDIPGELDVYSLNLQDEQEKTTKDSAGNITQISKYIHGVGDSKNFLNKLLGGVFGAGIIERIVRGYTFISRNYLPGDKIYLVGFSRGAYTVRALAGMIAKMGLLDASQYDLSDREEGYRLGSAVWTAYRKAAKVDQGLLTKILQDAPAFFHKAIDASTLLNNVPVEAVCVWETVGALGIPKYRENDRVDLFQFADTELNLLVKNGRHAISIDEQRVDFTPAIWNKRVGIQQVLFPGIHADIGGGYASLENGNGLSNTAYVWMRNELKHLGVNITLKNYAADFKGQIHCEWGSDSVYKEIAARTLLAPLSADIGIHRSAIQRLNNADPLPTRTPEYGLWENVHYQPESLKNFYETLWVVPEAFYIVDDRTV